MFGRGADSSLSPSRSGGEHKRGGCLWWTGSFLKGSITAVSDGRGSGSGRLWCDGTDKNILLPVSRRQAEGVSAEQAVSSLSRVRRECAGEEEEPGGQRRGAGGVFAILARLSLRLRFLFFCFAFSNVVVYVLTFSQCARGILLRNVPFSCTVRAKVFVRSNITRWYRR